jgi:hypothetical protein
MEPWRGTLPMCRSWIRGSGRDTGFAPQRSPVQVSQTSGSLKASMVVNFMARRISRGACKLTQTPILIIIKKNQVTLAFTEHVVRRSYNF